MRVCGKEESKKIEQDPVLRRRIITSRVCFRNKNAGKDPTELARLKEPAVKAKARLCVHGFKDPDKNKLRRDSPTASRLGVMMVLLIIVCLELIMIGGDASTAFLQGGKDGQRQEPLYMRPPRIGKLHGVDFDQLLEIIGSVFGLINAPRLWYRVIAGFLMSTGWKRHSQDPAVFILYQAGVLVAVLALHVDDVLIGVKVKTLLIPMKDRFAWGDGSFENDNDVIYCGRRMQHEPGVRIRITKGAFCGAIEVGKLTKERRANPAAPLVGEELSELSSCIGSLNWVGGNTRPLLMACTSLLQGGDKTVEVLVKAHSLLKELKDEPDIGIEMVPIDLNKALVLVHADGSWANAAGHRTQSGYVVFAAEPECVTAARGKANPLDWRSHRLRRACHCTLYVEAISSRSGAASGTWARQFLLENDEP